MGTTIALMSGKGGSGKTTLALSLADLLANCRIKTLLVDSDFSTNGASYFYESYYSHKNEEPSNTSFFSVLNNSHYGEIDSGVIAPIAIKKYMDFLPSVITNDNNISIDRPLNVMLPSDPKQFSHNLRAFVDWARESFDVIIFDCQAGYTEGFTYLLPHVDEVLFVLEADSVSAAALRNLHLKVGRFLNSTKPFQVFNKVSEEERDVYSKIIGTFFLNIGALKFDWKIRQAFSRSQIPDLNNVSAEYSFDLCTIASNLFKQIDLQTRIKDYCTFLEYQKNEQEMLALDKELYEKNRTALKQKKEFLATLFPATMGLMGAILSFLLMGDSTRSLPVDDPIVWVLIAASVLSISTIITFFIFRSERSVSNASTAKKMQNLEEEQAQLRSKLIHTDYLVGTSDSRE